MKKCFPKISIVTICYNSEMYIEEAIKSVVEQEYENKEYIIIDGGSTDKTLSIIERYKDRIDYFVSEPDKGISDAFNKGIHAATGDVIGIINSDDMLAENALQIISDNYDPHVDVYRGICRHLDTQTREFFDEQPTMRFPALPLSLNIAHPATFVSKKAYDKYGMFDETFKSAMDFELLYRYFSRGAKFRLVPNICAVFRLGGISQQNNKIKQNELYLGMRKNGISEFYIYLFSIYIKSRIFVRELLMHLGGCGFLLKIKRIFC